MKKQFVKTSNYERFRTGITAVENRGAAEASMMLVLSEAGYGKSATVDQWAVQNGAVYLRAKQEWTSHYFMTELAEALKIDQRGRAKDIFGRVAAMLGAQQIPLVVDKLDHCLHRGAQVLEAIRDISDLTEIMVILVGMDQVQTRISRYKQISSRIAHVVEFKPASLEDVAITCEQLAEVDIDEALVAEIHRQSNGRMREIMNAIATCERVAKRNQKTAITLQDMAGQTLTHDWQARKPRVVKGA